MTYAFLAFRDGTAVRRVRTGKPVEVCFFPVPNIDEVSFGTALNKAFGVEVASDLGMDGYKPGSTIRTYLVQYSNVYWAKKVSA